mmetsp:Transcript_6300/g.8793  ORF Transcript_6300/g.8793 Transcript_6300/m.8793 type:complete len:146 (+) Transcript_6300:257-694(+)
MDQSILSSIETFRQSLFSDGENLRGEIILSFFDQKEHSQYFGLVVRHENIYFERWKIPIVVINQSLTDLLPDSDDSKIYYQSAYDQLHAAIVSIMDAVNSSSDHLPLANYDFEIYVVPPPTVGKKTGTNDVTRLIHSPPLFNSLG